MKKIVVTGGSGRVGRAVIHELLEHGYEVLNVDIHPPDQNLVEFRQVDLTNYGKAFVVLHGADAVIHMAANPSPDTNLQTGAATFHHNMSSTYNIFNAAIALGLERVVWASSITVSGYPYNTTKIAYAPLDEDHPVAPESSYALSKAMGEEAAKHFARWSGVPFIGLRYALVVANERAYEHLAKLRERDDAYKIAALWAYVDARDTAQICRLSLEADIQGAEVFNVGAPETMMKTPTRDLLAKAFPEAEIRGDLGEFETIFSIEKARRMLGYAPKYSWREYVPLARF
jgi:nucleoside-diphosphate-sugar epimerase